MQKDEDLKKLVTKICDRPRMFVNDAECASVAAYIDGWLHGSGIKFYEPHFQPLNAFIAIKLGYPAKYSWTFVIKSVMQNSEEGISLIKKTILEFLSLKDQLSYEEIIAHATATRIVKAEGKPEKTFRKFDQALFNGKQEEIEPMIIPHPQASILWRAAYPKDISKTLNQLNDPQPVGRTYESTDKKTVKISSAGWPFPIEMKEIDGVWKINAVDIINMRIKNIQH